MKVRHFHIPRLLPPLEKVLGRMGYNKNKSEVDETILYLILDEMEINKKHIKLVANVMELSIDSKTPTQVVTQSGLVLTSEKLSKILSPCTRLTLLACTIGEDITAYTRELGKRGEMTRAVIADAIGSESVEAFAEYITDVLTQEKTLQNMKATMRYSPGYGDLSTNIHPEMLKLLDAEKIGIRTNPENFLLTPEKTITAIIGWYK